MKKNNRFTNWFSKVYIQNFVYFTPLFLFVIFFFRNAFSIDFFLDDFFFLKIGKASNFFNFLHFFSPIKDYFYRPIPTESFYFLINSFHQNLFLAHVTVFIVYFIGLYFLYKTAFFLSKKRMLSYIFVGMYAINFVHVFQLYEVATCIEIALFTFLTASFYFFLRNKFIISIFFFICALMSKETSVLYPFFLSAWVLKKEFRQKKNIYMILLCFLIAAIFVLVYKYGTSHVVSIDIYAIQWKNPRLMINNLMWYFLWSLGVPNFIPDYVKSILLQPLPDFWNLFKSQEVTSYLYLFILYYSLLTPVAAILFLKQKRNIRNIYFAVFIIFFGFVLFISPTIPIIHRWMVRLTLPLLFIIFVQSYIIYKAYISGKMLRIAAVALLLLYIGLSRVGTQLHESSGLFLLDSHIVQNARIYFAKNKQAVGQFQIIYFVDSQKSAWGGSEELKNMFHDSDFANVFFPGQKKIIQYNFDTMTIPKHAFVVESNDILSGNGL